MSAETGARLLAARLKAIAIHRSITTTQTSATLSQSADRLISQAQRITELEAANATLRAHIQALEDEITELAAGEDL